MLLLLLSSDNWVIFIKYESHLWLHTYTGWLQQYNIAINHCYYVTMLDQLKWQKLEHRIEIILVYACFSRSHNTMQVHFPTNDIPAPAPITTTRQSHERNFLVPYIREQMYINIHFFQT